MYTIQALIVAVIFVVAFALILKYVLPYLKKRDIDLDKILAKTNSAIANADKVLELVRPFMADSPAIAAADYVRSIVREGVLNAEQLNHIGKLPDGERETEARKYIANALGYVNIAVTPELQAVIDGSLQANVFGIGHKTG